MTKAKSLKLTNSLTVMLLHRVLQDEVGLHIGQSSQDSHKNLRSTAWKMKLSLDLKYCEVVARIGWLGAGAK